MILNEYFTLSNGVKIPKLGLGTWDKGDVYQHPSFKKAHEIGKTIGGAK